MSYFICGFTFVSILCSFVVQYFIKVEVELVENVFKIVNRKYVNRKFLFIFQRIAYRNSFDIVHW